MKTKRRRRSPHGQGLIEGTVAVCMIFGSGVAIIMLLLNSGTCVFSKEKLAHVSHLAAQYAASHGGDSEIQSETASFVAALLPEMGMQASQLAVEVKEVSVKNSPGVQVTVSNAFPLFGTGNLLPVQITLSDTDCVVW